MLGFAVLGLIHKEPMSGYDLRKVFAETALGNYSSSPGAIYPALARLEKQGLIIGKEDRSTSLRPKKIYRPSAEGKKVFRAWLLQAVTKHDINRSFDELMLRFAFHDVLGDNTATRLFLQELADGLDEVVADLVAQRKLIPDNSPLQTRLALEAGERADPGGHGRVGHRHYSLLLAKLLALTIVLLALSAFGSAFLPAMELPDGSVQAVSPPLGLVLGIFFFQVLALSIPVLWSRWTGWRLSAALFVVYFGTVTVVTQIESLIYLDDKMPGDLVAGLFAMGFFVAAAFSPICVLVLGRWRAAPGSEVVAQPALNLGRYGWRIAISGLVFLGLYYLFGYYIAWQDPELRAYYGGTDPGSFLAQMRGVIRSTPWMIPAQFARGLMYVGLGILVMRAMRDSRWHAGLAIAMLFAAPALYLLMPNPVMPDFPRMTHLVETLPYQFLFGWFLAWFLHRNQVSAASQVPART